MARFLFLCAGLACAGFWGLIDPENIPGARVDTSEGVPLRGACALPANY